MPSQPQGILSRSNTSHQITNWAQRSRYNMSNSNKQNTNIISVKTTITVKIIINSTISIKQPGLKALTSGNQGGQVGGHEHLKQTTGTAMQYIITLQETCNNLHSKVFTNHFHNCVFQYSDHPKRWKTDFPFLKVTRAHTHTHRVGKAWVTLDTLNNM